MKPSCFYCGTLVDWFVARLTAWGRVYCPDCTEVAS